jgi:hypothetical protein
MGCLSGAARLAAPDPVLASHHEAKREKNMAGLRPSKPDVVPDGWAVTSSRTKLGDAIQRDSFGSFGRSSCTARSSQP